MAMWDIQMTPQPQQEYIRPEVMAFAHAMETTPTNLLGGITIVIMSITIVIITGCTFLFFLQSIGMISDLHETRSAPCMYQVVDDTNIIVTRTSTSLYIIVNTTPRYLLDLNNPRVVPMWKQLKHNDIINVRMGSRTIAFCEGLP